MSWSPDSRKMRLTKYMAYTVFKLPATSNQLLRGKTPLSQLILKSVFSSSNIECKFFNSDLDNYMYMELLDELFYKHNFIHVYSELCLSRIHWDWRNSFDLIRENSTYVWLKTIENKEQEDLKWPLTEAIIRLRMRLRLRQRWVYLKMYALHAHTVQIISLTWFLLFNTEYVLRYTRTCM